MDQKKEGGQDQQQADKATLWAQLDAQDSGSTGAPALETTRATDEELEQAAAKAAAKPEDSQGAAANTATAAESTAAAVEADPYAGLPQAIKDEILGLKSMVTSLGTRVRNAEGHIGGLNHQLKEQVRIAQRVTASGESAPSAAELAAATGSESAMAELKANYPEFGAALERVLDERVGKPKAGQEPAAARSEQLPEGVVTKTELAELRREIAVEARHPGWQQTVATPAFIGWIQQQPREVQMLAASDQPADAIRLIDLFSVRRAREAGQRETRQQNLDSAAALPNGRSVSAKTKPVEEMTKEEYWKYLDQLDQQRA